MEIKKGLVFTGIFYTGRVEVIEVIKEKNQLIVSLTSHINSKSRRRETWNLEHVETGFDNGNFYQMPESHWIDWLPTEKQEIESLEVLNDVKFFNVDDTFYVAALRIVVTLFGLFIGGFIYLLMSGKWMF